MDSPALNLEDNLDQVFNELENCETHIDRQRYKEDYVAHQTTYEGTPLSFVKKFLAWSNPQDNQTVYDLGSGLGRVIIYGALNCPAIFKGIEIVPERVKMSQLISKKLELKNAVFYCADAVKYDFSDGDIFFLFNPFCPEDLQEVAEKLKEIAKLKKIKIASWGGSSNNYFSGQSWLRKSESADSLLGKLDFFESI